MKGAEKFLIQSISQNLTKHQNFFNPILVESKTLTPFHNHKNNSILESADKKLPMTIDGTFLILAIFQLFS